MRTARALTALGAVALSLAMTPAFATAVYQQPTLWAGNGTPTGSNWTSSVDTSLTGFRAYDSFVLAAAQTIDEVTWWGVYLDGNIADAAPNTTDWIIRFQADNNGAPSATLVSETIADSLVTRVAVGTGITNFGTTVTVYRLTAPFLPTFAAAPLTTYWFSPLARSPNLSTFFAWTQGTGGDGSSFQTQSVNGAVTGAFVRAGDRAFTLAHVPEPASLLLVAAGLLAAFVATRLRFVSRR